MKSIYNKEIKERFLSTYDNEQTQNTIRNVFVKTYLTENTLEKDLFEQTLSEIGKSIENTNPHGSFVSRSIGRFISQYITWATENGLRQSNLNPLKGIEPSFYDKYVDKSKKIHYSIDEFHDLLEEMQNGQDQAFLYLMYMGIIGNSFSQIKELQFSDVDWDNNTVYVKERDEKIPVTPECIKYLDKAYKQNTYYTFNQKSREYAERELLPSNYVFKNIKSPRSREYEQIGQSVLYSRLISLKSEFALDYLTPNALKQSGMLYYASELYKENGKLEYEEFEKIGDRYGLSKISANGHVYYNTTALKEYVSESNLKELYDIDIKF